MKSKQMLLGLAVALSAAGYVKADSVTFTDTTPANGVKEFAYDSGLGLFVGPGFSNSVNNNIKLNVQVDQGPLSDIYRDVYMTINSDLSPAGRIAPSGPAVVSTNGTVTTITETLDTNPFDSFNSATLGPSYPDFELLTGNTGTKNGGAFANQLLLGGFIQSIQIVLSRDSAHPTSGTTGEIKANYVTYTDGDIYDNFNAAYLTNPGSFTFALSGITGTFGVNSQTGQLNSFTADASGTFDATLIPPVSVPLPLAAWGGMGLLGLLGGTKALRKRNQGDQTL